MQFNPYDPPTAFVEGATWVDKFGRVRRPRQTFCADDGTVHHGIAAVKAAVAHDWNRRSEPLRMKPAARPTVRTAGRDRRPRRSSSSSTTSGSDPGDPDPDPDSWAQVFTELRAGGLQLTLFGRELA